MEESVRVCGEQAGRKEEDPEGFSFRVFRELEQNYLG
jgi:hypothetical protein